MIYKPVMKPWARPPPKPAINLTGDHYGSLTVVERQGNQHGSVLWLCRCTCGETRVVRSDVLRHSGYRLTCGNPVCRQKLIAAETVEEDADAVEHARELKESADDLDIAIHSWGRH